MCQSSILDDHIIAVATSAIEEINAVTWDSVRDATASDLIMVKFPETIENDIPD